MTATQRSATAPVRAATSAPARPSLRAVPARGAAEVGWRTRLSRPALQRYLAQPYASLQLLLVAVAGLLVFGVLMAISTTIAAARDNGGTGSIWGQGIKEAEFVVLGLIIFWFALRLSPRAFRVLAYPMLAIALLLLVAVLVPGIGVSVNGAHRWIDLGPLELQPSEFAKAAMLIWGADLLARKQQLGTLRRARHLFVPLVPGFAVVTLLVMAEPDLGTTCTFMLVLLGLLWMVGMPLRYFLTVLILVSGVVTVYAISASYRLQRLTSFTDPFQHARGSGYHAVEALYALASGGVFGVGLGQGTSKYGWVPNANTDYVFAIIGEELGLVGCIVVLALFGLLAYSGMRIAKRNADPFVRLAAGAATIWLCGQALINVGYVTNLLPSTGIPLPLVSAGGTSLLVTFFVLGLLASFARHEALAVTAARKAERLGTRNRFERFFRIPVPRSYVPPKRRPAKPPARRPPGAARSTGSTRSSGALRSAGAARPAPRTQPQPRNPRWPT